MDGLGFLCSASELIRCTTLACKQRDAPKRARNDVQGKWKDMESGIHAIVAVLVYVRA
jgi:hypothetical protein